MADLIAIVTPCGSSAPSRTADDTEACMYALGEAGIEFVKARVYGSDQPGQMITAVDGARRAGATHLAVIEHDHRFPPDAFIRLLKHGKPIIGANYRERQRRTWTAVGPHGKIHSRGKTGIEEVVSVGFGVCLIDMKVFEAMPRPWFSRPWVEEANRHMTCDVVFGHTAKAAGFSSFVDHDLSQSVGHIMGELEAFPDRLVFTVTQELFCNIPESFDIGQTGT